MILFLNDNFFQRIIPFQVFSAAPSLMMREVDIQIAFITARQW